VVVAAVALLCLSPALARAEAKIGVVDIQRAITDSEAGKKAKEKLGQRAQKIQDDLKAKNDAVEKLEGDLKKQEAMLTPEAKREKERELERKKRDLAEVYRDYQEEFSQAQAATFQPLLKEVEGIVNRIGSQEGYTLIIEKAAGVIYSAKGTDLTDTVIKALNEGAKKK
jgi:outer membrane protein